MLPLLRYGGVNGSICSGNGGSGGSPPLPAALSHYAPPIAYLPGLTPEHSSFIARFARRLRQMKERKAENDASAAAAETSVTAVPSGSKTTDSAGSGSTTAEQEAAPPAAAAAVSSSSHMSVEESDGTVVAAAETDAAISVVPAVFAQTVSTAPSAAVGAAIARPSAPAHPFVVIDAQTTASPAVDSSSSSSSAIVAATDAISSSSAQPHYRDGVRLCRYAADWWAQQMSDRASPLGLFVSLHSRTGCGPHGPAAIALALAAAGVKGAPSFHFGASGGSTASASVAAPDEDAASSS